MKKQNRDFRVTIRLTEKEFIYLKALSILTYRSGSISRLIRYYLQPVFDTMKDCSSIKSFPW